MTWQQLVIVTVISAVCGIAAFMGLCILADWRDRRFRK